MPKRIVSVGALVAGHTINDGFCTAQLSCGGLALTRLWLGRGKGTKGGGEEWGLRAQGVWVTVVERLAVLRNPGPLNWRSLLFIKLQIGSACASLWPTPPPPLWTALSSG